MDSFLDLIDCDLYWANWRIKWVHACHLPDPSSGKRYLRVEREGKFETVFCTDKDLLHGVARTLPEGEEAVLDSQLALVSMRLNLAFRLQDVLDDMEHDRTEIKPRRLYTRDEAARLQSGTFAWAPKLEG